MVSNWKKIRDTIVKEARSDRSARKAAKQPPKYRFADVDKRVVDEIKRLRGAKKRVGPRWIVRQYRKVLSEL